jgi:hypothetical protein
MTSHSERSWAKLFVRLGASAAAGLLAWLVMQRWYPFFLSGVTPHLGPSPEEMAKNFRAAYLNSSAVITIAAALIGAALALCDTISRRSLSIAVIAVLAGAVLGGAGGTAGGSCGQRLDQHIMLHKLKKLPILESLDDTPRTIVVQGACWGLAGLGIGLGVGILCLHNLRTVIRSVGGGVLGGVIAGLIFPLLTAPLGIILPLPDLAGIVPDSALQRLLWLEVAAISIAIGTSGSVRSQVGSEA